jgi:hypothetical protein
VRSAVGALPVTLYRRDVLRPLRDRTTGARLLSALPSAALQELLETLEIGRPMPKKGREPTEKPPGRLVPRERSAGA